MSTTLRYTLGKTERLKSKKQIELLFKEGKSFSLFPYRIIYLATPCKEETTYNILQAGFSVSRKNFKHAVDRNRLKRLSKEAYRLQKHSLQNSLQTNNLTLQVFFIYTGKEVTDYNFLFEKMEKVLSSLIKKLHEKNAV